MGLSLSKFGATITSFLYSFKNAQIFSTFYINQLNESLSSSYRITTRHGYSRLFPETIPGDRRMRRLAKPEKRMSVAFVGRSDSAGYRLSAKFKTGFWKSLIAGRKNSR